MKTNRAQHAEKTQHETVSLSGDLSPLRRSLRAGNRSPEYIANTLRMVEAFGRWLAENGRGELRTATRADIQEWMDVLLDRYAIPTVVSHRAALRTYYRMLRDELGLRDDMPTDRVRLPQVPESEKDVVPLETLAAVLKGLDTEKRYLEAAIISVLADTGMRASELAQTRVEDVDLEGDPPTIFIPGTRAKNKTGRIVGFTPATAARLDRWMATRPDRNSEWLFTGQPDHGVRKPFTRSGLLQLVRRVFRRHGLDGIGPHDLRHTWATHSLNHEDARELDVMAQGGWSSTRMLANYTRAGRQRRAAKANLKTSPLAQISERR